MSARPVPRRRGFTLIELMAVIVVIGLTLSFVLPNLTATRASRLRERAKAIAGRVELARERAVVTGAPHRLLIDLEEGAYAIDWFVSEARSLGMTEEEFAAERGEPVEAVGYTGQTPISLMPPTDVERAYYPIPNRYGRFDYLPEDYVISGVDTPEGFIDRGSVQIVFERDGTSDHAEIHLHDRWDNRIVLEVQPLLETVRIHEDVEG